MDLAPTLLDGMRPVIPHLLFAALAWALTGCTEPNPSYALASDGGSPDGTSDQSREAIPDAPELDTLDAPEAGVAQDAPEPTAEDGPEDVAHVDATFADVASSDAPAPPLDSAAAPDVSVDEGPPPDLTTGLLAHWKLDEASGATTAADASGNGYSGVLVGLDAKTAWTNGHRGGALSITAPGVGAGLRVTPSGALDRMQTFTLAAWVSRTPTTAINGSVISRQLASSSSELYNLAFTSNKLVFYFNSAGTGQSTELESPSTTPSNTWTHVAATYDGTTAVIYQDGRIIAAKSHGGSLPATTNPIYIGNNQNSRGLAQPMFGLIDDVVVYGRVLPPDAIAALASGAAPP